MKQFLRFSLSALILLVCCIVADSFIGITLDRMIDRIPNDGNETGAAHFAIKRVTDPVLIIGSSRAKYHYYPSIIADSLSLETYNAGRGGFYLSYHCCLINMILDRYTPDIIIWDFSMDALFADGEDLISKLRPYYWDYDVVRKAFDEKEGPATRIKTLSNAYRYNGMALSVIYRWMTGGADADPTNGMTPIINNGQGVDPELHLHIGLEGDIDPARVERLHNTLQRLHDSGVRVYIFDSPNYSICDPNRDRSSESIIYEECERFAIPVFDNRNLDFFLHHPEMFYDEGHLFDDGAEIYTRIATHQILQTQAQTQ